MTVSLVRRRTGAQIFNNKARPALAGREETKVRLQRKTIAPTAPLRGLSLRYLAKANLSEIAAERDGRNGLEPSPPTRLLLFGQKVAVDFENATRARGKLFRGSMHDFALRIGVNDWQPEF
jgi:hypothetical protein